MKYIRYMDPFKMKTLKLLHCNWVVSIRIVVTKRLQSFSHMQL